MSYSLSNILMKAHVSSSIIREGELVRWSVFDSSFSESDGIGDNKLQWFLLRRELQGDNENNVVQTY